MNPISFRKWLRLKVDRFFHISRNAEYGMLSKSAYLSPDTIVFNKRNLYMEDNTSIPGGGDDIEYTCKVHYEER